MSEIYDAEWAHNYERRADAAIPGRDGLYRLCRASFRGLPAGARILVIGCGTGSELIPLAHAFPGATIIGIEPAQPMLDICAARVSAAALSSRVSLQAVSLEAFSGAGDFDAATSILVSQHISSDSEAGAFFRTVASLLKPGGRLYTADLHIATGQAREAMLALWREQALMSGTEPVLVDGMLSKFESDLRPRDESTILGLLQSAGFHRILKPFSSLIYGAWAARRSASDAGARAIVY